MSILWLNGHVPKIDILPEEELQALVKKIRPCYMVPTPHSKGGETSIYDQLTYMVVPHLSNQAFTWDPQPHGVAEEWREHARIETNHTCGYAAFFKPSIDEVLSQIPKHLRHEVNAFVTLSQDPAVACYSQGDGHRSITILYSAKQLDEEQNPYYETAYDALSAGISAEREAADQ